MKRELSIINPEKIELVPVGSLQKIFMKKEELPCRCIRKISGLQGTEIAGADKRETLCT